MSMMKKYHKRQLGQGGRRYQRTWQMFRALQEGDVQTMNQLLKEGGLRINARSPASGQTLLHEAVLLDCSFAVIRRLIRAGCRIETTDPTGDTALHLAARFHKIHIAVELIKFGADVRARNHQGETPLQLAVMNKCHVDPLEMIPNGDNIRDSEFYGLVSLHLATGSEWRSRDWIRSLIASYGGSTIYDDELYELVKMLLDAGADINARDNNGCSPIQCAVYTSDCKLVQALIDAGANLDNQNNLGATALHDVVLCCNEEMVHLLLSRGAEVNVGTKHINETALFWALRLNRNCISHIEIIRRLMEFKSDLNYEDVDGETPFQLILQFADVDLVILSIDEYKADFKKLQSNVGGNVLAIAAQNEDERVIDLLLQRLQQNNLEIDHRCKNGETALHHASGLSLLKNVRQLLYRGADVNAKDSLDRAPIVRCIFEGKIQGHETDEVPLPYFRATLEERRRVLRLLLEYGTDVNNACIVRTWDPEYKLTVLEMTILFNEIEAWKMIIEYAAEVEARTNKSLFDERNLRAIETSAAAESYYQKCRAELKAMKTTKIEGSRVSYWSVLTQQLDVVARYTRNGKLVKNLQFTLQSDVYPIYASQLKKKFDAASAKQERIDQAFKVLSESLHFADLNDSILENICKYL